MSDEEEVPDEAAEIASTAGAPPESSEQQVEEKGVEEPRVEVVPEIDEADLELARQIANDAEVDRELRRLSRRGFVTAGVAAVAGVAGWTWLRGRPRIGGVAWPFRRVLEMNERIAEAYFRPSRMSPTFRPNQITQARINGGLGLSASYSAADWRLHIEGAASAAELTIDDIRSFPRHELITEFRCIEGWSYIVKWTGARLSEVMARYPPPTRDGSRPDLRRPERLVRYVSMETADHGYYVGLDMQSALHPQTLLAYEINGQPLSWQHGAPLRLAIPVKYGVKNIKRIGTIRYTDVRPADYWAERGYDWYAGH